MAQQRQPDRQPDQAALDAWTAYRTLRLLVDAEVARDLEQDSGLSMPDYEVLAAVVAMSTDEVCIRVNRLAARMQWTHSRLSRQLGRMGRRGLIAREPCELDGRGDDILPTESGRQAHDNATPAHLASVHRRFTNMLSATQIATLTSIEQTITQHQTDE